MSEINEINTHIEELRKRVIRSIISILVITVFILTFHATPFDVMGVTLYYPYPEPLNNIAAQFTNVMRGELVPDGVQLIQTAPGQAFFSQVYIAALIGIVLSIPIIVREFISFLKPGVIKIFSKLEEENYYVEDGIVEFKNNNLSVLTSFILNIKDLDTAKINDLLKEAETYSSKNEITDQNKYLMDQKIDVLKNIN